MVDLYPGADVRLREAIELFYFAYRAFTAGPDGILGERGLGRVHHRILYFVGRNPQIAVNELLAILAVSKQALNGPLRRLVGAELVRVRSDAHDRRFKRLSLTARGRSLERRLTGTQMRHLAGVFARAGAGSEASWKSVMRAIHGQ
jgi:DNA-binding MarR family transcriptional regulator